MHLLKVVLSPEGCSLNGEYNAFCIPLKTNGGFYSKYYVLLKNGRCNLISGEDKKYFYFKFKGTPILLYPTKQMDLFKDGVLTKNKVLILEASILEEDKLVLENIENPS